MKQKISRVGGPDGFFLCMEKIATQLFEVWSAETRFSDVEKAQLFIGYLAAFPKKEESEAAHDTLKENEQEEQKNEQSN